MTYEDAPYHNDDLEYSDTYNPDPPSVPFECLLNQMDREWLASAHIHPFM
jgi:hypothetical protein